MVRGFWKSLSKTNTSGWIGAPTPADRDEVRIGRAPVPGTPLNALLRNSVWPRLPLVERDEASARPGMRP